MTTITDVRVQVLEPLDRPFQWVRPRPPIRIVPVVFSIDTDAGVTGQCMAWLVPPSSALASVGLLESVVVSRDPHFVEQISADLTDRLEVPSALASAIDIALWDLLGKIHNEPVYKLLGAARDRIRAYASTVMYETDQEYVDLALECRAQGFTAFKLHPYGIPDDDIRLCRVVREAVGDTMDLMLDPVNLYDKRGAFKVGHVLDELNFHWFEAPLMDSDVDGLVDLRRAIKTPISAGESVRQGLRAYPRFLSSGALDSLRSVGDWIGGISAMRKVSALCEAYNVPYEPHHYGPVHIQAAHMHVSLATVNAEFVEIPVPLGILDAHTKDTLRPGADGCVSAPTKPGLGYDLDLDSVERATVARAAASDSRSSSAWVPGATSVGF